tara:strand:+ start:331 stop:1461 length:1131 start_codon:yes stop_codon:yes gene_type:complete
MGERANEQGIGALLQWNALLISFALFLTLAILGFITKKNDWTNIGILIVLIIIALALLITSADFFVEGAKGLARRAGMAEVVIGLTIVSIGTSLPEIFLTATAAASAAENDPALMDLAVGNIYGSVLVQITLILGIVVAFKPLDIRPAWLRRDGLLMLFSVLILTGLLWEGGGLSRIEGAILCLIYVLYIFWLLTDTDKIREDELETVDAIKSTTEFSWSGTAYMIMVVIGLSMAVYSATRLVDYASEIAYQMNVPHAIVGSAITGVGTSLPELTVAMVAVRKSQGVAIGTLIGSNITDPLLSIGIAALIAPISLTDSGVESMSLVIPVTILGVTLCLGMMWTGFKFSRFEGAILIAFYIMFLVLIELQRQGYLTI